MKGSAEEEEEEGRAREDAFKNTVHLAAPLGGPAREVVRAALSGAYPDKTHAVPASYEFLHVCSRKKLPEGMDSKERLDAQRDLLARFQAQHGPVDADALLDIGAVHRHVINSAGVAVMQRIVPSKVDSTTVEEGFYIKCFLNPKRFDATLLTRDHIIFEDDNMVVVDKPKGLPSVASRDNYVENVCYEAARLVGAELLLPVHRLDTPTTGTLVLAKSSLACRDLHKGWAKYPVSKCYEFIAEESPSIPGGPPTADLPLPGSLITHWMDTSTRLTPKPIAEAMDAAAGLDKEAKLILSGYDLLPCEPGQLRQARCRVQLITGRTHQIRAQFGRIGWPLKGDLMYQPNFQRTKLVSQGVQIFNPDIDLRCYKISFSFRGRVYAFDLNEGTSSVEPAPPAEELEVATAR